MHIKNKKGKQEVKIHEYNKKNNFFFYLIEKGYIHYVLDKHCLFLQCKKISINQKVKIRIMRAVKRNPLLSLVNSFFIDSPLPSNISYMWNFGSLLGLTLVLQIATGVTLAMHYIPNTDLAFASVEHIMRDVNSGYLIRYAHANGASMFFILVYLHVARGIYYGSYTKPRLLL